MLNLPNMRPVPVGRLTLREHFMYAVWMRVISRRAEWLAVTFPVLDRPLMFVAHVAMRVELHGTTFYSGLPDRDDRR